MQQLTVLLQQYWWAGLIPITIAIISKIYQRQYQKTHVQSQFVVSGCLMSTLILVYYIVCIVAALFSILGFFLK